MENTEVKLYVAVMLSEIWAEGYVLYEITDPHAKDFNFHNFVDGDTVYDDDGEEVMVCVGWNTDDGIWFVVEVDQASRFKGLLGNFVKKVEEQAA